MVPYIAQMRHKWWFYVRFHGLANLTKSKIVSGGRNGSTLRRRCRSWSTWADSREEIWWYYESFFTFKEERCLLFSFFLVKRSGPPTRIKRMRKDDGVTVRIGKQGRINIIKNRADGLSVIDDMEVCNIIMHWLLSVDLEIIKDYVPSVFCMAKHSHLVPKFSSYSGSLYWFVSLWCICMHSFFFYQGICMHSISWKVAFWVLIFFSSIKEKGY